MTNQESLDYLNKAICTLLDLLELQKPKELVSSLMTLQELVHKEEGAEVDERTKDSFPNIEKAGTSHTTYQCPVCGCTIHLDWHEKRNYCPECGTKLIWKKEK